MKKTIAVVALVAAFGAGMMFAPYRLGAATPGILNYQGRVLVGGVPFSGTGQFKFALVNSAGTTSFWSNDGTSASGSEPTAAVSLAVASGLYSILLGDTTVTGITVAIPATVFDNPDVRLRIWFNDGSNGSKMLSPDQRVAPVGYAQVARAIDDGSVTTAKIVDGAVTQAKLAAGVTAIPTGNATGDLTGSTYSNLTIAANAVNSAKIADGAVTQAKLAAGVTASPAGNATGDLAGSTYSNLTIAANAVTTGKIVDGAVTSAKIASGVIPTTLPPNGTAGGDLTGTYPNPTIAANAVTTAKIVDGAVAAVKIVSLPKCRVFSSVTQSVPPNTYTSLNFDQNRYDSDSIHPVSSTRLTCKTAGVYHICANVSVSGSSSGFDRRIGIRINGNNVIGEVIAPVTSGQYVALNVSTEFKLNVNDFVEVYFLHDANVNMTVQAAAAGLQGACELSMSYIP